MFCYTVSVDPDYDATDDAALNRIAMRYLDPQATGLTVYDGAQITGKALSDVAPNDGNCYITVPAADEEWLNSEVTVRRGEILPGVALAERLVEENYVLLEVRAPEGYDPLTYPLKVARAEMDETDLTVYRSVANDHSYELPQTGGVGSETVSGIGLTLLFIAFAGWVASRRRRNPTVSPDK